MPGLSGKDPMLVNASSMTGSKQVESIKLMPVQLPNCVCI